MLHELNCAAHPRFYPEQAIDAAGIGMTDCWLRRAYWLSFILSTFRHWQPYQALQKPVVACGCLYATDVTVAGIDGHEQTNIASELSS